MGLTNFEQALVDINGNPYGVSGSMALPVGAIGQLIVTVNSASQQLEYLNSVSGALQVTGSVTTNVMFPSQIGVYPTSPSGFWSAGPEGVTGSVNVYTSGPQGVTASAQLPVYSTGPVGVTASAQIPVFNTGLVGVSGTVSVVQPVEVWQQGIVGVSGSIHTGSTANGFPVTDGGVYYGSGNVGSLPAYVQSMQVDPSGAVYITTSGSLPVYIAGGTIMATVPQPLEVWNFSPVGVTGSVNVYTSGPQAVSGTVTAIIGNWPATIGVSASYQLPVYNTGPVGVTASANIPVWQTGVVGVSGTVSISQPVEVWQQSTVGISGSWTSGSVASVPVMPVLEAGLDRSNVVRPLLTDPQGRLTNPVTGSTVSSLAASTANQVALASNPNRVGAIFWNEGSANAYVKLGPNASKTSYTVYLGQKSEWEMPYTYQGEIDVVFDGTTGNLRITELY